jgi:hypothetical protein
MRVDGWDTEGRRLSEALSMELGPEAVVGYHDERSGQVEWLS